MEHPESDGSSVDGEGAERELRMDLLRAQIEAHEIQNKRGWGWHMGPTLSAILASVAASVILVVFGGELARNAVAYFKSGVADAEAEQARIVGETHRLTGELNLLNEAVESARKDVLTAERRLGALSDFVAQREVGAGLSLSVQIVDDGPHYMLHVDTDPPGADVVAFALCDENLVFPSELPNPELCQLPYDLFTSDGEPVMRRAGRVPVTQAPCLVGPIGKEGTMDKIAWVMATREDDVAVRLVYAPAR